MKRQGNEDEKRKDEESKTNLFMREVKQSENERNRTTNQRPKSTTSEKPAPQSKRTNKQQNKALHPTAYSPTPSFVPHYGFGLPAAGELVVVLQRAALRGIEMKAQFSRASAAECFWWNWDATKSSKNIRLISLEYIISADEIIAGISLTIWSWRFALIWPRKSSAAIQQITAPDRLPHQCPEKREESAAGGG